MSYVLGVDLGTSFTAAAVFRDGRAEIVDLGRHRPQIPTVVHVSEAGELAVGDAAERRAVTDPHGVTREFKRRLGDQVGSLVRGRLFSAEALLAEVLRHVLDEVTVRQGEPPVAVALTHPANWGPYKTDLMRAAARLAGLDDVLLVAEPVAASLHRSATDRVASGQCYVVYDLGGGTFDVSLVSAPDGDADGGGSSRTGAVLGVPDGLERLGGIDFDEALRSLVEQLIGAPLSSFDTTDPRILNGMAQLRAEVVVAKEALSVETHVDVPLFLPGAPPAVRVTRAEFEQAIEGRIADTMAVTRDTIARAGLRDEQAEGLVVLLVGGSSRIPLVGRMVAELLNLPVALDEHPKHAVAFGAARLAALDCGLAQPRRAEPSSTRTGADPVEDERSADPAPSTGPVPWVAARASDVAGAVSVGADRGASSSSVAVAQPLVPSGVAPRRGPAWRRPVVLRSAAIAAAVLAVGTGVIITRGDGSNGALVNAGFSLDAASASQSTTTLAEAGDASTLRELALSERAVEAAEGSSIRLALSGTMSDGTAADDAALGAVVLSSSDAAVAGVTAGPAPKTLTIVALKAGSSTVTVQSGATKVSVPVTVRAAAQAGPAPASIPASNPAPALATGSASLGGQATAPVDQARSVVIIQQPSGGGGHASTGSATNDASTGSASGSNGQPTPGVGASGSGPAVDPSAGITTTTTTTVALPQPAPVVGLRAGTYEEGAATYDGGWRQGCGLGQSGGCDQWTSTAGRSYSIVFYGSGIAVYGAAAFNGGQIAFTVDGVAAGTFDSYFDGNQQRRKDTVTYFQVGGLATGTHTLSATMLGSRNPANTASPIYVTLDKFVVSG